MYENFTTLTYKHMTTTVNHTATQAAAHTASWQHHH